MSKTLEEKMQEIEISLTEIKRDIKYILQDLNQNREIEKRVRSLEDIKNKLLGMAILAGAIAGTISTIIIKILS